MLLFRISTVAATSWPAASVTYGSFRYNLKKKKKRRRGRRHEGGGGYLSLYSVVSGVGTGLTYSLNNRGDQFSHLARSIGNQDHIALVHSHNVLHDPGQVPRLRGELVLPFLIGTAGFGDWWLFEQDSGFGDSLCK